jgi:tetratricopeptide (TPR) repeat protein
MLYESIAKIHLLVERDKLDLAQQKLTEVLAQYPDSAEIFELQAEIYLKKDDYKNALSAVETAIGLNPENDSVFFTKARIHLHKEEYKNATKAIDQAIFLNPDMATYYGVKAAILLDTKYTDKAIEMAQKGLELDPDDLMCNNMLSMAHNRSGKSEEAFERLEQMLVDDPENILTHANTGYHYLQQGNVKKAKEHFAEALRNDPNFEFARSGMLEAIKGSNWLYRKLLQYSFWIQKLSSKNKWAFFIGIIVIIKLVPFLLPFYLIFIFWTWFTGPISDMILYFDKHGKYLMTPLNAQLTRINLALVCCSLLGLLSAIIIDASFFTLAFALFLSIIPVYLINSSIKIKKRYVMGSFAGIFIVLGIWAVYTAVLMHQPSPIYFSSLIIASVIFSWVAGIME